MSGVADRLAARAGEDLGEGDWLEVTQGQVDGFADLTDDHQWIHMAGERADQGPFGGPIAHGFLTLSLLSTLSRGYTASLGEGTRMTINYGFDRIRFVSPVPVGSRIRARGRLSAVTPVEGGTQVTIETTVEVEGAERPALVAEHLVRFYD